MHLFIRCVLQFDDISVLAGTNNNLLCPTVSLLCPTCDLSVVMREVLTGQLVAGSFYSLVICH